LRNLVGTHLVAFKKTLTPRERDIFKTRIFTDQPLTLQDIGERYDISRERVRQIEANIIKKMQEFFKEKIPDFDQYTPDTN